MALANFTNQQIMLNYEHICDLHILFKLAYILLLLKFVHVLIKFEQPRYVFVCDLVATIKVFQSYVYNMYHDHISKFITDSFWAFKSLLELKHENIHMCWIVDENF